MKKNIILPLTCCALSTSPVIAATTITNYYDQVIHYTLGEEGSGGNRPINIGSGGPSLNLNGASAPGGASSSNHSAPGSTASMGGMHNFGNVGGSIYSNTQATLTSIWFNMDLNSTNQCLFQLGNGQTLSLGFTKNGNKLALNYAGSAHIEISDMTFTSGEWYNAVFLYTPSTTEGVTGIGSVYINGNELFSVNLTRNALFDPNLHIGYESGGGSATATNSLLDDFQSYTINSFQDINGKTITGSDLAQSIYKTGSLASAYNIPEPSTTTLSLVTLGLLMLRRRRAN